MSALPDASNVMYADERDLQLGDVILPAALDVNTFLIRASRDIDIALGERYVVPILTGTGITPMVLRNVCADLATAYILFSVTQPTENNLPNAYALHLWDRAGRALEDYRFSKTLPGATLIVTGSSDAPISIVQEDAGSLVGAYETFVTTPNPYAGEYYGPWSGRYGDGFQ